MAIRQGISNGCTRSLTVVHRKKDDDLLLVILDDGCAHDMNHLADGLCPALLVLDRRVHRDEVEAVAAHAIPHDDAETIAGF